MIRWVILVASAATFLVVAARVLADDSGAGANIDGPSGSDDASANVGSIEEAGADGTTLACDGGLCDTRNGSQCDLGRSALAEGQVNAVSILLVGAPALGVLRRVRRRPKRGTYCP